MALAFGWYADHLRMDKRLRRQEYALRESIASLNLSKERLFQRIRYPLGIGQSLNAVPELEELADVIYEQTPDGGLRRVRPHREQIETDPLLFNEARQDANGTPYENCRLYGLFFPHGGDPDFYAYVTTSNGKIVEIDQTQYVHK